jgi:hypothetical protein
MSKNDEQKESPKHTHSSILYVPLSSTRQNKESEKGLFNTNKQKTNTRTYVNQRDDMLTKR